MRLVDLDALIYAWCDGCDAPEKGMCNDDMCEFAEIVKKFPTIDAVPVVRCKDCKNGTVCVNSRGAEYVDCVLDDYSVRKPTDFCSYGERRSEC